MSIRIIKERERITDISYRLNFHYKKDLAIGWSFPCDENGKVLADLMTETAIKNYNHCMLQIEEYLPPYVETCKSHYTEPAIGECYCGEHIRLENEYLGACKCPKCGRWYNMFGQELIPPKYWDEDGNEVEEYPW